ncbi:DDE Tnp 4 domain containing protein [Asbolus verrucosus]|uniref:DDE Tnp 4 domain containing protein n=1 Tax=Asbolus verrucosus TaxID=1661398 RepID=A0A482W0H1_ASBVE|nr:DDE Tnp 4 domain containing protein [Asbolus verrucosus]
MPATEDERNSNSNKFYNVARFPKCIGAVDYSHIKISSPGDGGYGIKHYLLTPLGNPHTPAEWLCNESQIRTRNPIERTFEIWKRRFPVLAFEIRLKLRKVETVVVATAVLDSIAILLNKDLPLVNAEEEAAV